METRNPRSGLSDPRRDEPDADLSVKAGAEPGVGRVPDDDPDVEVESSDERRRPRLASFVLPPPREAATAPGSRDPRRAADVTGAQFAGARHNWIPTGPRNVGGRVRALAIDPANPLNLYAGAASGGVYRSRDGGESWTALWRDELSLSMGAIGICRDHPEVVYVATGEIQTGGNEMLPGDGVYRSLNGGDTWRNASLPHVFGTPPDRAFKLEAIAVHPTNADHCWTVGPAGVFRTTDGGEHWQQFENGVYYSDVAFSVRGATPILYLVRARSTAGEAVVVRLDDPAAADAAITAALGAANNRSTVIAAPPPPPPPAPGVLSPVPERPARGKLAIAASNPDIAYVRFAGSDRHDLGVFRTRTARATPFSTTTWTALPRPLDWVPATDAGQNDVGEDQGEYNLCIAVSPVEPNHVATGMVELFVSRNANANPPGAVTFFRAMAGDLNQVDPAHHSDNHQVVFAARPDAPAQPPALWVANDGGISRSVDWHTGAAHRPTLDQPLAPGPPILSHVSFLPTPAGAITWRKRSHGISAAQMYDLTQSPVVPALYGCGFQDNGVWLTTGGLTWRMMLGADGGFVAFDPDDAYRAIGTWQSGIDEITFPGLLTPAMLAPGDGITTGIWPRELTQGFADGAAFVADTALHPRAAGRALHTRLNRLYGTRPANADHWAPEQVGRSFDVSHTGFRISVLPSPGAQHLGLVPQTATSTVRSFRPEPYALAALEDLQLVLDGIVQPRIVFRAGFEIANLARASAAEVCAYIRAECGRLHAPPPPPPPPPPPDTLDTVDAQPCLWGTPLSVEIVTEAPGAQITLGGTALTGVAAGELPRLGLRAGTYRAAPTRPASVTLAFPGRRPEEFRRSRDMTSSVGPALDLTIQIGAGPVHRIEFEPFRFPDVDAIWAGELAEAIRQELATEAVSPAHVEAWTTFKSVRLTARPGQVVTLTGTACDRLNVAQNGTRRVERLTNFEPRDRHLNQNVGNFNSFDLSPAPPPGGDLTLTISDGAMVAPVLTFNAAARALHNINDYRSVTVEELERTIEAHLVGTGVLINVDMTMRDDPGQASEIVYSLTHPDTVVVGGEDGSVFRSTNDGAAWRNIGTRDLQRRDRPVEAIAIHPNDTRTIYVGLAGAPGGTADPGFLFKTINAGTDWVHVGAQVADTAGAPVSVNALEIDPDAPETVFVATDVGVFRTTDGGADWQPFNEGLPNVRVRDLAFVPSTRTLRAGAWGRGTYERHVGDRPVRDVQLYVRAGELDDGSVRPAARGPAGYATAPAAAPLTESPDIKVHRDRPPQIGLDEQVDGVEFDLDITHDDLVTGPANLFVQVHNRGSFPAAAVRVVALWADVSDGPPPLPDDFWARFAAPPLVGDAGNWKLIADDLFPAARAIEAGEPRVRTIHVEWPPDIATLRRVGILVMVSHADDLLAGPELDVAALLDAHPKVAYREARTRRDIDDHVVFLRRTGTPQFSIANPAGPATPAAGALGLAVGGPVNELRGGLEPFALNIGAQPSVLVQTPLQRIDVLFAQTGRPLGIQGGANPADSGDVVRILNRSFLLAGFPARADFVPLAQPPPPPGNFGWAVRIRGVGDTQISLVAPVGPAVDASPALGLALGGPAASFTTAVETYPLNVGAAQTLSLTAIPTTRVEFPNAAGVTARDVRDAFNRALIATQMPVRAMVPQVDLWIRRSVTDVDGRPARTAGRHLADLIVEPAPAGDPPSRFDLLTAHGDDKLTPLVDNVLYLRTANLGPATQFAGRHRLFQLNMSATPITAAPIALEQAQDVPAFGSAISTFTWNPGPIGPERPVFVLAVSDHAAQRPLALPAPGFPSLAELDAFCDRNPNAAYRSFEVGP